MDASGATAETLNFEPDEVRTFLFQNPDFLHQDTLALAILNQFTGGGPR
jgi:hypothetical protein